MSSSYDATIASLAKQCGLVEDVLKLVAQSMCFSEEQKAGLDGPTRQKVEMMLQRGDFAEYRAAASEVAGVKERVAALRSIGAAKEAKAAADRDAKRAALKAKKTLTPVEAVAAELDVDVDMLHAVAQAMCMTDAQVAAAAGNDGDAKEKLRGVREGPAFERVRAAAARLGLVDEARAKIAESFERDAEDANLDDGQVEAAARALAMSDAEIEALDPEARRAITALREDPAFAGVRAVVAKRAPGALKQAAKHKAAAAAKEAAVAKEAAAAKAAPPPRETKPAASKKKKKKKKAPAPEPGKVDVLEATDDGFDMDGAWSDALAAVDDGAATADGGWSDPVTAADDDDDDGGWSDPVTSAADDDDDDGGWSDPVTSAAPDDDDDLPADDIDLEEEPTLDTPDHALRPTDGGYELTVRLPAGVRAEGIECDGATVRVAVPGRAVLAVALQARVDPAKTKATYKKKAGVLVVALARADDHGAFMEDLGREAAKRGYVPPLAGLEEVSETIKGASR